jgi:hypothetical protein
MENKTREQLKEHFCDLTDPRIDQTKHPELIDIVVTAICVVICGTDDWEVLRPAFSRPGGIMRISFTSSLNKMHIP